MKNKNGKALIGLTFWYSLILFIENLIAVGISAASVTALKVFGWDLMIAPEFLMLIFSVFLGCVLSFLTIKIFLRPLRELSAKMTLVSKGDFNLRLEGKTRVREIDNIWSSFNTMVEELGTIDTIQSDFISNVSHEFKTPISAIEGYSMLLQGCTDKDMQSKYVDKILFNTKRLSNLVSSVLLLAKLDNQKIQPKFNMFRLDEQIRQSILSLEIAWTEKDIELDVNLEDIQFSGTEELLMHVWTNLLANAIKFSPKNGEIKISLIKQGKGVKFSISDNGPGINEENIENVFNKFYQGNTDHKGEGSGLGLSLAKQIVLINNGKIRVKNNINGGCTFEVEF